MKSHKDLDVWKLSMEMCLSVYKLTEKFPRHELYGLTAQLRKASVSVASNMTEGAARQTKKEFVQFLYIALGSSAEIETQLELAKMLEYVTEEELQPIFEMRNRISQMLYGLIRKWKT